LRHIISNIDKIRQDYSLAELDEATLGNDPLHFFEQWFSEAVAAEVSEVNAMALATVDAHHKPHARIVLLKGLEGGAFTFFTNYTSAKGHQIAENSHVALLFFWKELERQVRIEGIVSKIDATKSDDYFYSRPDSSQLGAWASPQSQVITSRQVLEDNYTAYQQQFATGSIPRPAHWGGYAVQPASIEFWQGRSSRMHDRILFERLTPTDSWAKCRLAP
jgi:pyridoxamine 5'-phosphate oxidase